MSLPFYLIAHSETSLNPALTARFIKSIEAMRPADQPLAPGYEDLYSQLTIHVQKWSDNNALTISRFPKLLEIMAQTHLYNLEDYPVAVITDTLTDLIIEQENIQELALTMQFFEHLESMLDKDFIADLDVDSGDDPLLHSLTIAADQLKTAQAGFGFTGNKTMQNARAMRFQSLYILADLRAEGDEFKAAIETIFTKTFNTGTADIPALMEGIGFDTKTNTLFGIFYQECYDRFLNSLTKVDSINFKNELGEAIKQAFSESNNLGLIAFIMGGGRPL